MHSNKSIQLHNNYVVEKCSNILLLLFIYLFTFVSQGQEHQRVNEGQISDTVHKLELGKKLVNLFVFQVHLLVYLCCCHGAIVSRLLFFSCPPLYSYNL